MAVPAYTSSYSIYRIMLSSPWCKMVSSGQLQCLAIVLLIAVTLHDQLVEGEPTCRPLRRLTTAQLSALRSSSTSSINRLPELLTRLWCENDNNVSAAGNYVNLTFSQMVVVYGFVTRGDYDESLWEKREAYVKRFTLTANTETLRVRAEHVWNGALHV